MVAEIKIKLKKNRTNFSNFFKIKFKIILILQKYKELFQLNKDYKVYGLIHTEQSMQQLMPKY